MPHRIIKNHSAGIFTGKLSDIFFHRHYAVQISIALSGDIAMDVNVKTITAPAIVVKPQTRHKIKTEKEVMIFLLNPAGLEGHFINNHLMKRKCQHLDNDWVKELRNLGIRLSNGNLAAADFNKEYFSVMGKFIGECRSKEHQTDERILEAIRILNDNPFEIIPLENISSRVFLSPSRFLHLFKQETGISYRRMQLWNKLLASFDILQEVKSITELAHASGFADAAHYSRTF